MDLNRSKRRERQNMMDIYDVYLVSVTLLVVISPGECHGCPHNSWMSATTGGALKCDCTEHRSDQGKQWTMRGHSDPCVWSFPVEEETDFLIVHQSGGFKPGWSYNESCLSLAAEGKPDIDIVDTTSLGFEARWCFQTNLTIRYQADMCQYPDPNNRLQINVTQTLHNEYVCMDGDLVTFTCNDSKVNVTSRVQAAAQCPSKGISPPLEPGEDLTTQPVKSFVRDRVIIIIIASIGTFFGIVVLSTAVAITRHCRADYTPNLYSHLNISEKRIPPPSDPNRPLPSLPASQGNGSLTLTLPDINNLPSSARRRISGPKTPDVNADVSHDSTTSGSDRETGIEYNLLDAQDEHTRQSLTGGYAQCPESNPYEGLKNELSSSTLGQKTANNSGDASVTGSSIYHYEKPLPVPVTAQIEREQGRENGPIFTVSSPVNPSSIYSYEQVVGEAAPSVFQSQDYEEVDEVSGIKPKERIPSLKKNNGFGTARSPPDSYRSIARGLSHEPPPRPGGLLKMPQKEDDLELKHRPYSFPSFTKY